MYVKIVWVVGYLSRSNGERVVESAESWRCSVGVCGSGGVVVIFGGVQMSRNISSGGTSSIERPQRHQRKTEMSGILYSIAL